MQGIAIGVDVLDENTVDKILGTNKKKNLDEDGADSKVDNAEEVPAWDGGVIDVKSITDSIPRYKCQA